MSLALFVLASLQSGEPVRTVNDGELGPAEEFTTHGPATVCLRNLVVRPSEGQSVQLTYLGIHYGSVQLKLASGDEIEFTDGDNFLDQRERGQRPRWRQKQMRFYRIEDEEGQVRYQVEGRNIRTDYNEPPRVMVRGAGLSGSRSDRRLFDALSFEEPGEVVCDVHYEYGWGVILGDNSKDTETDDAGDGEEN